MNYDIAEPETVGLEEEGATAESDSFDVDCEETQTEFECDPTCEGARIRRASTTEARWQRRSSGICSRLRSQHAA